MSCFARCALTSPTTRTAPGTLARLPSPFNVVMASSKMAAASLLEMTLLMTRRSRSAPTDARVSEFVCSSGIHRASLRLCKFGAAPNRGPHLLLSKQRSFPTHPPKPLAAEGGAHSILDAIGISATGHTITKPVLLLGTEQPFLPGGQAVA
jgi:hypothetical protein